MPLGRWILVTKTSQIDINMFIEKNKMRRKYVKDHQIDPFILNQKNTNNDELVRDDDYMIPFVFDL
jgi:hypothetical protein